MGVTVFGENLKKVREAAGIDLPGFRLHDLRHSHGSLPTAITSSVCIIPLTLSNIYETPINLLTSI